MTRLMTTEKYAKKVRDLTDGEYELVGEYIDSKSKVKIRHNKCNHVYEVNVMSFRPPKLGNKRVSGMCPICESKSAPITKEKFLSMLQRDYGNSIKLMSNYVDYMTPVIIERDCGHAYEIQPKSLFTRDKTKCKICRNERNKNFVEDNSIVRRLRSNGEVLNTIKAKLGNDFEIKLLSDYKNYKYKNIKVIHKYCGHVYINSYDNIMKSKSGCPACAGNKGYSAKKFKELYLSDKFFDEYELVGDFIKTKDKITLKHKECNNQFKVSINPIREKTISCPHCQKLNDKTFKDFINKKYNGEYTILSKYTMSSDKVYIQHNTCGHRWWARALGLKNGSRKCPLCSKSTSRQERFMYIYLNKLGINFEYQKSFFNENTNSYQKFDFFIPEKNIAIEVDGVQHYDSRYHRTKIDWEIQKMRDREKTNYCLRNGIKLIRIFPNVFDDKLLSIIMKSNGLYKPEL